MKKLIISVGLLVLLLPKTIFAQGKSNQIRNRNEIQIQNQQQEQQIQVENQEQESTGQAKGQPKDLAPRSQAAKEHMSEVAKKVEEILTTQGAKGGIGEQISQIAQEQKEAQRQTEEELTRLDARPGWLERIIGPNYKAIKNLRQQIEKNQLRIRQLEQLQEKLKNKADQQQIQQTIQALVEQNTALQQLVLAKEKIGSLFGWLFKLFAR